jgi:hypothetical protein
MRRIAAGVFVVAITALVAGLLWIRFGAGTPPATEPGTPLTILTGTPLQSGEMPSCELAALGNVRVEVSGTTLLLVNVATGQSVNVVWPYGFSARLAGGRGEIVASDGAVVGREGDVLNNLGGGYHGTNFNVCMVGSEIYPK